MLLRQLYTVHMLCPLSFPSIEETPHENRIQDFLYLYRHIIIIHVVMIFDETTIIQRTAGPMLLLCS